MSTDASQDTTSAGADGTLLAGRVAVVTGGASGLGRAAAFRLCLAGASVVAGDLNADSGAELLDAAARAGLGDRVRFVHADVSDEQAVADLIDRTRSEFGSLDVMFNNAGVGGAFGDICDIDVADWDYTFAVNCRSVFLGIKHAARAMRRQGRGGSIINTASIGALAGDNGPVAYSAAKAAVVNLTMSSAVALADARIRVNCICPGSVLTPLLVRSNNRDRAAALLDSAQPWPSHGKPHDVAGTVLYLASELSAFVTGATITVDGGAMAAGAQINRRLADLMGAPANASGVSRGSTGVPATVRLHDSESTA